MAASVKYLSMGVRDPEISKALWLKSYLKHVLRVLESVRRSTARGDEHCIRNVPWLTSRLTLHATPLRDWGWTPAARDGWSAT